MRPYLIEGLDCSGKKTVAGHVSSFLSTSSNPVTVVVGPILGGRLGRINARLANLTEQPARGSITSKFRRAYYTIEPALDGLFSSCNKNRTLKVSSHYRAWARAEIESDTLMDYGYRLSKLLHMRFSGVTLLVADFDVRLMRHVQDVAMGKTRKRLEDRFMGPSADKFDLWNQALERLLHKNINFVQVIDTSRIPPLEAAMGVATHWHSCDNTVVIK